MNPSSRLIPPSLCELEDYSELDSNIYSNGNTEYRKYEQCCYTIHNSEEQNMSDIKGYTHINIRINGPEEDDYRLEDKQQRGQPVTDYNTLNEQTTGYSNFKESFSQEDILQAFKAIDLNKDGQIDVSDLRLFLDYMKEAYTQEQLNQMIGMFNQADGKFVGFDEFRRLASGEIIGLTTSPSGDKQKLRIKSRILSNIEATQLKHTLVPTTSQAFVKHLRNDRSSLEKRSQVQAKLNGKKSTSNQDIDWKNQAIEAEPPAFNKRSRQQRQQLFQQYVHLDYESIRQNCAGMDSKLLSSRQLGKLLEIAEADARRLYPQEKTPLRQVLLDTLSFSILTKLQKLQESLCLFSNKKVISFNELVRLLTLMQTQEDNIPSKLNLIYRKRRLSTEGELKKETVLAMLTDYVSVLHI